MAKFSKNFKELFSFTRGETIGVAVLLLILLGVFLYPYIKSDSDLPNDDNFNDFKAKVDLFEASKTDVGNEKNEYPRYENGYERKKEIAKTFETFDFDPNTADKNTFMRLGFSDKQAESIIKYRNSGGKFKTIDDFKKMYVVSPEYFERLAPHIKIAPISDNSQKPYNVEKTEEATTVSEPKYTLATVEINSADTSELKKLRGIGSYYAQRIAEYRTRLGGFVKAEQLREVRGIDDERFEKFAKQIKIDLSHISKIKINEIDEKTLAQHPYISNYEAKGIMQYRKLSGKIDDLNKLVKEKILKAEQVEKLIQYVEY